MKVDWKQKATDYANSVTEDNKSQCWETAYTGYIFGCARAKNRHSLGNYTGIFAEAAKTGFREYIENTKNRVVAA